MDFCGNPVIYKKIQYLTLTFGTKFIQNVAQYPLHHVTYAPAKFEVATSNGLGGDAFTREYSEVALMEPTNAYYGDIFY